jgi:hypothetical protein
MTLHFTAATCPLTQDYPMTNEIDTSSADIRSRQLIACVVDLQTLKAKMSLQPDKVLKYEFHRKYAPFGRAARSNLLSFAVLPTRRSPSKPNGDRACSSPNSPPWPSAIRECRVRTAAPVAQCRSNPVSSRRLPKTGVFRYPAGDFGRFRPESGKIWSLETDSQFAKARH